MLSFALAGALVLLSLPARADDAALVEIAERYASDGKLEEAKEALAKAGASAKDLLQALRRWRPSVPYAEGERKEKLEDGHGGTTDLFVVAPSEADAKAAEKEGGLSVIVALHGLGGNGRQLLPVVKHVLPPSRTIVVAPTAQKLPKGLENPDGASIFDALTPHWWLYKSPRSFPLEALRWARRRYPVNPDRVILLGYSMGGFGTWNIGLRYPDRFAGLAPCAGGLSRAEYFSDKDERSRELLGNAKLVPLWFTHGDSDEVVPVSLDRRLHAALDELKIQHVYEEVPGGRHILPLASGGGNMPSLSKWAAARQRNPAPREVEFTSQGDWQDGAYWLRVGARSKPDGTVRLLGAVDRAKNAVAVKAAGPAESVDVWLDDRLLDLSKKVTVSVEGGGRFEGVPELDVAAVLESFRSREDRGLVYAAKVRLALGEAKKVYR